jgi:hypothetical protein
MKILLPPKFICLKPIPQPMALILIIIMENRITFNRKSPGVKFVEEEEVTFSRFFI